jgi:two-component system, OmpR family, sensor histidine kinase CreC
MTRLWVVGFAAIGLIAFVTLRMQVFIALATIVGAFAFGLGILVIDRVEARASKIAQLAATEEALAIAALIDSELDRNGTNLEQFASTLENADLDRKRSTPTGLELLGPDKKLLFPKQGARPSSEPGTVQVEVPISNDQNQRGRVRVVKPTILVEALLADIAPTVLVISLVLGSAAAIAAAWIGRRIAAPIEALSDFGEQVSAGLRPPLPQHEFGREVSRLIVAIDTMRRKLEGRPFVETFAADLSHELKNPVAALIASAEVLEDGALDDPPSARRFVRRMREAAERIESMTEELLDLAQVETRRLESKARLDLTHIARDVVEELGEARARVLVRSASDIWVRGDAAWLARALDNLLSNALIHSPKDSTVHMHLEGTPKEVIVEVESEGEVPLHVRDHIFRRFVTTRRTSGGTGLGLPIVQAVAEAHGGSVLVSSFGPPKVTLRLTLPRA